MPLAETARRAMKQVATRAPGLVGSTKRVVVAAAPIWDPLYVAWCRRTTGHRGPIPSFANRRRVGAWQIPSFLGGGKEAHDALAERFAHHTGKALGDLAMLDLACGPGRIAQYFHGEVGELTVCDVDPTAIDYMRNHFPKLRAVVSTSDLPLPFDADAFDLVLSWSLWTHLPRAAQSAYLDEVVRVLRPGGWVFLTVNGHQFLDHYQAFWRALDPWRNVTHEQLRDEGVLFAPYESVGTDMDKGVTGSFGLTFNDPAQIRADWSDRFEIIAIEEGAMHNRQDLVVLRVRV